MKKILLALLASTAVGGLASAQSFPDVASGSYAEEAVARLADLGIVIGFPDGTFRGNDAFTRYQAALVVSRLLDVVDAQALSDEDLDTVRNALQELASDVAANEQAVSDLQAAIDASAGADPAAIEALQAQLDALTVQLDTLSAEGDAQLEQLSEQFETLNEDVAGMSMGAPEMDTSFLADIEQNASDVANLREFVVLLRRDQVGLTDRLATIEESDAAQTARLDDIESRVTALEENQVAFGGSISLDYSVGRLSGVDGDDVENPFDVDRIFGIGLERPLAESVFSTGNEDLDDDDDDADDPGEPAQDREDIENETGDFSPGLTLSVDFSAERGLAPESGLNSFESTVALELVETTALEADADVDGDDDGPFDFTDPDNWFDAYVFEFQSVTASLGPIGADPLNFYYGDDPGAEFSDYVFESLGPGFRADVGTPDFLAFLQPTLQIAYGVYNKGGDDDDDTLELPDNDADELALDGDVPVANPWADAYYRGLRGTLTPFSGEGFAATGGFSVGQIAGFAGENADAADDNVGITAYSVDGDVTLSVFNLTFEYAANDIGDGAYLQEADDVLENEDGEAIDFDGVVLDEDDDGIPAVIDASGLDSTVTVAELTIDTEAAGIPLLRSLSANYRDVPEFWYGLKYDEDTYPWETDQVGFGVEATAGLSIFTLGLFYDQYEIAEEVDEGPLVGPGVVTGDSVQAYGVDFGAELYRAVEVYGFYNYVTLDGTAVDFLTEADRNDEYRGGYGVGLRHDGESENALFPSVNFDVAYNFQLGTIEAASVDTEVTVGALTIAPFVDYSVNMSNLVESEDDNTIEAGLSLSSEPLDVLLQPSLAGNVNYRNTFHYDLEDAATDYTTDVLQYSIGVNLNQFLFENSVLGVRYGQFSGTNLSLEPNTTDPDDGDFASDISDDDVDNGGAEQTTNGYELTWDYYGLAFGYGVYFNTNPAGSPNEGTTAGQAFSISYTVNF